MLQRPLRCTKKRIPPRSGFTQPVVSKAPAPHATCCSPASPSGMEWRGDGRRYTRKELKTRCSAWLARLLAAGRFKTRKPHARRALGELGAEETGGGGERG
eukprot:scaffold486_cov254-Pinguiococcus_pyrenoidosus.AAC.15